ncbi:MAG: urease accessory protein UreD [Nitrospinota bacterium]
MSAPVETLGFERLPRPELSAAGRHGAALARFEVSRGRTILRDSYSRVPLQIVRPLYPEGGDPAHLTLINPTGGSVGGDRLEVELVLGEGSRVLWTTQGATRIYRTEGEPVVSRTAIRMEKDSVLEFIPDPIIPYAGSRYRQEVSLELEDNARLLYGETLFPGRVASGEAFGYNSLTLRFEARLNGALLLRDAIEISPRRADPRSLGLFEPYPYMGTFYVLGGSAGALDRAAENTEALLAGAGAVGVAGGASRLEGPGVMIRWLAESPVRLRWAFDEIWNIARLAVLGRKAPRLRKF